MPSNDATMAGIIVALENIKDELKRDHKRLDSIDSKLDNHVTHIEHRLTQIETTLSTMKNTNKNITELTTTIKNLKWIVGSIFLTIIGIFGMVFVQMVF